MKELMYEERKEKNIMNEKKRYNSLGYTYDPGRTREIKKNEKAGQNGARIAEKTSSANK